MVPRQQHHYQTLSHPPHVWEQTLGCHNKKYLRCVCCVAKDIAWRRWWGQCASARSHSLSHPLHSITVKRGTSTQRTFTAKIILIIWHESIKMCNRSICSHHVLAVCICVYVSHSVETFQMSANCATLNAGRSGVVLGFAMLVSHHGVIMHSSVSPTADAENKKGWLNIGCKARSTSNKFDCHSENAMEITHTHSSSRSSSAHLPGTEFYDFTLCALHVPGMVCRISSKWG